MSNSNLSIKKIKQSNDDELFRVKERPNYLRDSYTNALFMLDEDALAEHEEKKKKRQQEQEYQNKVDNLENDINDIKHLLSVLINKVDNR